MWTGFLLEYLAFVGGNPNWAFDWWRFEMEGGFDDENEECYAYCTDRD